MYRKGKRLRFLSLCAAFASLALAAGPELEQARKLYNLTDFEQSLHMLQAIPQKDAAIYELMGRDFYMLADYKKATEALEKAVALRPDLIVLDLSMPQMNGVEVASLLRARMPLIPVVIYTMFEDVLGKSLTATLGIAAIVSKSDGLTRLLARIEALLESPTLVQPPAG